MRVLERSLAIAPAYTSSIANYSSCGDKWAKVKTVFDNSKKINTPSGDTYTVKTLDPKKFDQLVDQNFTKFLEKDAEKRSKKDN